MADSKIQNLESMNESFLSMKAESEKTDDDYEVVRQSSDGSDSSPSESGASNDQLLAKDGEQTIDTGIKDLGWNRDSKDVAPCMISGVPNDVVWTLIRRFNKVGNQTITLSSFDSDDVRLLASVPCQNYGRENIWKFGFERR